MNDEKPKATLVVHNFAGMTVRERKILVEWLRKNTKDFVKYMKEPKVLAKRYRARLY